MVSLLPTKTLTIDGDTRLGQSGVPALLWLPVVQGLLPSNFHSVMMGRGSTQEPPSRFLHFAALLSQSVNLGTIWLSWKGKVSFPVHSTLHWLWRWQLSLFFRSFQWPTPIKLKGLFLHWIELRTQEQPLVAEHRGASRTRRTHEVPFIAGCGHFTRKNARFRAPASSPKQSPCNIHAAITMRFAASRRKPARIYAHGGTRGQQYTTIMQPLQHHVANLHVSTHVATPDDNNHAAISMWSATTDSRNEKNYAHRNNHSLQNTKEEPKRPQPHPPHTRGTFHRRPRPLYREKHKVSCSGFLPTTKPHATFMQPLQCVSQHHVANLHVSTHMAAPEDNNIQQSCSPCSITS